MVVTAARLGPTCELLDSVLTLPTRRIRLALTCQACWNASSQGAWWSVPEGSAEQEEAAAEDEYFSFRYAELPLRRANDNQANDNQANSNQANDNLDVRAPGDASKHTSWMEFVQSPVTTRGLHVAWHALPEAMSAEERAAAMHRFMDLVAAKYPALKRLSFCTPHEFDPPTWLTSMTRLRVLVLQLDGPRADNAVLDHVDLRPLRSLRALAIHRGTPWDEEVLSLMIDAPTVALPPSLEFLVLRSCEVTRARGFLAGVPALRVLRAEGSTLFMDSDPDDEERVCYDVGVPPSLQELYLHEATYSQTLVECLLGAADNGNDHCPAAAADNLHVLSAYVTVVPSCVGRLPALRELKLIIDDTLADTLADDGGHHAHRVDALATLTTLRELTYENTVWEDHTTLPYLPGVTRLEAQGNHSMVDAAYSLPNLKHLRVSFSEPTMSCEPLSRLTALTSLVLDACEKPNDGCAACDRDGLPPNLHLVRSLQHLCMHAFVKGSTTTRRALGACSIKTVCNCTVFVPEVPRPTFSVIDCPVPRTRFHEEYQ